MEEADVICSKKKTMNYILADWDCLDCKERCLPSGAACRCHTRQKEPQKKVEDS